MKQIRFTPLMLATLLFLTALSCCAQGTKEEYGTQSDVAVPSFSEPPGDSEEAPAPEVDYEPDPGRPAVAPFESELVTRYPVEPAELQPSQYGGEYTALQTVANGANNFALQLSGKLVLNHPGENFVCSPYSVWLPLAALVNATDGAYRERLLAALGAEGITEADLNQAASRMLYDLTKERDREYGQHDPLHIVNAVFVDKSMQLSRSFAQSFLDCFRGQALNIDFSSDEAVSEVNRWASENTEGLITDIIEEFTAGTVAAIANAIYFSDRWDREFNSEQTEEGVFYAPDGEAGAMFMQLEGDGLSYYEDELIQAMGLRFKAGGMMYVLLPEDGDASGLLATLDDTYFLTVQQGIGERTGTLLLPRFRIASDIIQLDGVLNDLGVPLFDAQAAPLTDLLEGDEAVWLSSAIQKAVIEVDEKGTTAAAVTIFAVTGGGPERTEPFRMVCDRPFVFLLCDRTIDGGNQILFTGVVNRPE